MKFLIFCAVFIGLACAQEQEEFSDLVDQNAEARFLYFNTSSTATSLTLLGALILLGVIAYLVYAGGLLGSSGGYNRNSYANQEQYAYDQEAYPQYRSNDGGDMFNSLNIIKWISMLNEVYEKFDYNDIECQKRLICEVTKEPEFYGSAAEKFKTGLQYAKYLEVLSLPDEMRELLDEYLDANNRAEQNKECEEYFQCPYSVKDAVKRNLSGNSL